jgi:hypothetical protein
MTASDRPPFLSVIGQPLFFEGYSAKVQVRVRKPLLNSILFPTIIIIVTRGGNGTKGGRVVVGGALLGSNR